jgi:DNA-binding CsgD family transcriptional regulator
VRRTILLYGLIAGLLVAVLRVIEYRYLVVDHALEIYGGLVAVLFAALGAWLGRRLLAPRERVVVVREPAPAVDPAPAAVPGPPVPADRPALAPVPAVALTRREQEILELIAAGLSTREMAERLGVSENTVKSHASRLFDKLGVRRRTQAVQSARAAGLLP